MSFDIMLMLKIMKNTAIDTVNGMFTGFSHGVAIALLTILFFAFISSPITVTLVLLAGVVYDSYMEHLKVLAKKPKKESEPK